MHGDLDLNGHGVHDVLSFQSDNIMLKKEIDLSGHALKGGGSPILRKSGNLMRVETPTVFASDYNSGDVRLDRGKSAFSTAGLRNVGSLQFRTQRLVALRRFRWRGN